MVQHKVKSKVTLPKGVQQKAKKAPPKQKLKKGQFLHIAPKKANIVQQERVAAEVTRIINQKNEDMVKGVADNAVGRNQTQAAKK